MLGEVETSESGPGLLTLVAAQVSSFWGTPDVLPTLPQWQPLTQLGHRAWPDSRPSCFDLRLSQNLSRPCTLRAHAFGRRPCWTLRRGGEACVLF
jgi:hypothetical protein